MEHAAPHHALPPVWLVTFFVVMLLAIAVLPLTPLHHWWEKNRNRLLIAVLLGAVPAIYYAFTNAHRLEEVFLHEYIPFIALLGSLFVISGGIRVTGDLRATPSVNSAMLAVGTLLASFIGTTGASMLLIRVVLQTNAERQFKIHTVVFFIFLVSNIGGCLLPIGDPPLFLGYLAGVPFFWTLQLWKVWAPVSGAVLLVYYLLDRYYYARELPYRVALDRMAIEPLRVRGGLNFVWLLGVVASVIWIHGDAAWPVLRFPFLREVVMVAMVAMAWITTPRANYTDNEFTFGPILEVAALFLGIFVTMVPALDLLQAHGGKLGVDTPTEYFWGTGVLSSFLDNAPTYLVFFKTAAGAVASGAVEAGPLIGAKADHVPESFLIAISLGAVFMGANTYIGNGPNFMVKAIAENAGIRMPSFFGYMRWSLLVLVPIFIAVTFVFLDGMDWLRAVLGG